MAASRQRAGEAPKANDRLQELLARPDRPRASEDRYRSQWTWDSAVNVTHIRGNCSSGCSLTAFVKDGEVIREEQNAIYEQTSPDVPDFNPRGCLAGCVYSQQMYDPTRILHPMKRTGPRGGGRWARVSWDRALEEIADRLLDTVEQHGPECIVSEIGTNGDYGNSSAMEGHLLGPGLGAVAIDIMSGVGDLGTGLIQAWGVFLSEGTADDWFRSDYVLNWISNPAYTHQPDVHFIYEARYRGSKVISIAPDFSPSTVHADLWLNVRNGTDAALALSMVNVIIEERLYELDYVREQTDLPFLVRDDNRRYLRESDVREDGADDVFFFLDENTGRRRPATGTWGSDEATLKLQDGVVPALEGDISVRLKSGRRVRVRPVFEHMRRRAAEYGPERASAITGVAAANIQRVAREFAAAKSAMIFASGGAFKHYHSDLYLRGMAYLCALTGNSGGRPGSGIRVGALWPSGSFSVMNPASQGLNSEPVPDTRVDRISVQALTKATSVSGRSGPYIPLIPFLYTHDPEWRAVAQRDEHNDPSLTRAVAAYMQESLEAGWEPVWPKPPKRPQFYWFSGGNPLRRWPNPGIIRRSLWQQLETIVAVDFRWSTSALWADYVLPAAGWYEKPGIRFHSSYTHHVHVGEEAVAPLGDSKAEFDLVMALARKVQERARSRGIEPYTDPFGREHNPRTLYDDMSAGGVFKEGPEGQRRSLDLILKNGPATRTTDLGENAWETAAGLGAFKPASIKPSALLGGVYSDYSPNEPIAPLSWFTERKEPWPTITGRQQFYLDHDWFFETGEEMLVHKEPPATNERFPIRVSGGHTRWSLHSTSMSAESVLRLQRGEPAVYMSVSDARQREIEDGDRIRLFNDVGSYEVLAKVAASVRPGMAILYHGWEGYQFKDWAVGNDLQANPPKPNNLVGDYGHLHYRPAYYTMNQTQREVTVQIEKADP